MAAINGFANHWRQQSAERRVPQRKQAAKQKGRRKAGLLLDIGSRDQYFATTAAGPPNV
jgi:hypothetical protein